MIQLRHITKTYNRDVLHDISLDLQQGKMYVIKGVSGCGKSTLLNIIGGLLTDYEGEYYVHGTLVDVKTADNLRRNIGYIFQESLLFAHLTVEENLNLISNEKVYILQLCQKMQIQHLLQRYPAELSNGERQRISIIRALANHPMLVLADEPTASLDPQLSEEIAELFYSLKDESRILLIATHEECFDPYADEIIHINYGHIDQSQQVIPIEQKQKLRFHEETHSLKTDIKYSIARRKKQKRWNVLLLGMLVLMVFVGTSMLLNFKREVTNRLTQRYPIYTYSGVMDESDKKINGLLVYENHEFIENNVQYYDLFAFADSAFRIPEAIQYGQFPATESEILVNRQFVKQVLKLKNVEKAIGKTLKVKGKDFKIKGILTKDEELLRQIHTANEYTEDKNVPYAYIPYKQMASLHKEKQDNVKMFSVRNVSDFEKQTLQDTYTNYWKESLKEQTTYITFLSGMLVLTALIILLISALFMYNVIRLDVHSRKKEIGFLKLFSLSNRRISTILCMNYGFSFLGSVLVADTVFFIGCFSIHAIYHMSFWIPLGVFLLIHVGLFFYVTSFTLIPLRKIMKTPTLYLITGITQKKKRIKR